jgi:hypothetical protein
MNPRRGSNEIRAENGRRMNTETGMVQGVRSPAQGHAQPRDQLHSLLYRKDSGAIAHIAQISTNRCCKTAQGGRTRPTIEVVSGMCATSQVATFIEITVYGLCAKTAWIGVFGIMFAKSLIP